MNNTEALAVAADKSYERLSRWAEIDTAVNEFSEQKYGVSIDPGVNDLVVGLNALLGEGATRMSCEGHADMSTSPWVSFSLATGDMEHDRRRLAGLVTLLNGFYESRETEDHLRLGIYPLSEAGQGAYEITTAIGHAFYDEDADIDEMSQRATELLPAQQAEVLEFSAYVQNRYLSGFTIDG